MWSLYNRSEGCAGARPFGCAHVGGSSGGPRLQAPLAWWMGTRRYASAAKTAPAARLGAALCICDAERKENAHMAHLGTVLEDLGLEGEVSPLGRWARLQGEEGRVYVADAAFGSC